jgi:hypothetical protein
MNWAINNFRPSHTHPPLSTVSRFFTTSLSSGTYWGQSRLWVQSAVVNRISTDIKLFFAPFPYERRRSNFVHSLIEMIVISSYAKERSSHTNEYFSTPLAICDLNVADPWPSRLQNPFLSKMQRIPANQRVFKRNPEIRVQGKSCDCGLVGSKRRDDQVTVKPLRRLSFNTDKNQFYV